MVSSVQRRPPRVTGDSGGASVMLLCLGIAAVILALGVLRIGADLVSVRRFERVADLAALAAARKVLQGGAIACEAARTVALANQAELSGCHLDDVDVVVGVRVPNSVLTELIGGHAAVARAGPAAVSGETSGSSHVGIGNLSASKVVDQAPSLDFPRSSGVPAAFSGASSSGASSSRSATHS